MGTKECWATEGRTTLDNMACRDDLYRVIHVHMSRVSAWFDCGRIVGVDPLLLALCRCFVPGTAAEGDGKQCLCPLAVSCGGGSFA